MSTPMDFCGIVGNTKVPDENGIVWAFDIPDGDDSPDHLIEFGDVTGRDGSSLDRDDIGSRLMMVTASARVSSAAQAELAYRIMVAKLPPRRSTGPIVKYETVPKTITVRRANRPRVKRYGNVLVQGELEVASIEFPYWRAVTANDPVTINAGASASLVNEGDEAASIRVSTTGAGTMKLQRTDNGQLMQTRISVASGTVFDSSDKSARTSAGVEIFPMSSPNVWFYVPANGSLPLHNVGTAPVTIQSYDTYL